jgi:hypothetical protein
MKQVNVIDFKKAVSDFELLDIIRLRYQMFANDIKSLSGILCGYGLAKEAYEHNIMEFSKYLTESRDENQHAVSWGMIIEREASKPEYEIPIFFTYLDEYRKIEYDILGEVELTWEQRDFDFRRLLKIVNIDYPELPIKAPHKLKAVKSPQGEVHAFYYDENELKYYEQCLREYPRLKKWARECFDINEKQW